MTIEESFSKMKAAFESLTTSDSAKAKELADMSAKALAAETALAEKSAAFEALNATISALTEKVNALEVEKKELASAVESLKNFNANAGKTAATIVASVGVDPVAVSPAGSSGAKSDEDISAEWISMKQSDPKAARSFYDSNRAAILRAAGIK